MKIDWKKFSNSKGYKSLKKAVIYDCNRNSDTKCFNTMGCKVSLKPCSSKYCDKFKYIIDKVKHLSYKYKVEPWIILDLLEEQRTYWYLNYYQDHLFWHRTESYLKDGVFFSALLL